MCESCGPVLLRSGDRVLIAFHGDLTATLAQQMRDSFEELFPGVVIVLVDQVESVAVHRPDQ